MVLHYSPDVDAIVIDLTPAKQAVDETVALSAPSDAFLDVDTKGRGVRIEFLDASAVFACHFCDHSGDDADGRQYASSLLLPHLFSSLSLCSLCGVRPTPAPPLPALFLFSFLSRYCGRHRTDPPFSVVVAAVVADIRSSGNKPFCFSSVLR